MKTNPTATRAAKRRFKKSLIAILAIGALVQGCGREIEPEESCNFVQNESLRRISWQQNTVPVYIHDSVPIEFSEAIQAAANVWNDAFDGKNVVEIRGRVSGVEQAVRDGYNIIYYRTTWAAGRESEQARTTLYWAGDRIYEADIQINGAFNPNNQSIQLYTFHAGSGAPATYEIDLQSLMVHEIGHLLGLAHVPNTNESVMHTQLANGSERRKLSDTDLASLSCEYGV